MEIDFKNAKVRVLHTENSIGYTGAFKALFDFCIYSKNEIESIWVIKKGSTCKRILEEQGIKVYELPFVELSKNPLHLLLYFPFLFINSYKLRSIALKEKIDVFHSNDLYNLNFYLVKYLFRLNKPLLIHVRMLPASFPSALYKIWKFINIRFANKLIAVSQAVKKAYGNPATMEVIYDVQETIEKHPEYKFKYDKTRPFKFLYLANYIDGKGQDYALKAFSRLVKKNTHVTLTFVGGDLGMNKNRQFRKRLEDQVVCSRLEGKVFFENFTDDVEFKLKNFDASLNFSFSESFSMVSFESLRFGVPLISSDCGGPAELFEHKHSGWLVSNKSVEEMAEAMYNFSINSSMMVEFSLNSKKYIEGFVFHKDNYKKMKEIILNLRYPREPGNESPLI